MFSLVQAGWFALALLFAVPLLAACHYFINEDGARRRFAPVTPYLVYVLPLYCAVIGTIGTLMNDPHTAMTGFAVAIFSAFPAMSAWRKRGQ